MKLESLKSSKFEAFKGSELQNSFKVFGGKPVATTVIGGTNSGDIGKKDTTDKATSDGIHSIGGKPVDFDMAGMSDLSPEEFRSLRFELI